jgi:large subunit ribosomal protein L29
MKASELRTFSTEELKGRVRQWREELFRARFKSQSSETKDTSVLVKLRKDIARGNTVLTEKLKASGQEVIPVKKPAPAPKKAPKKPVEEVVQAKAEEAVAPPAPEAKATKGKSKSSKKSKAKEREI